MSIITNTAARVWVPNRNGVLINLASAYAERNQCKKVWVGFNREEAVTFPDNSQAFLEQATKALSYSTQNQVQVCCHTTQMDKIEMVQNLKKLDTRFPFELIWSCYQSGTEMCGQCESCQRYKRAMK